MLLTLRQRNAKLVLQTRVRRSQPSTHIRYKITNPQNGVHVHRLDAFRFRGMRNALFHSGFGVKAKRLGMRPYLESEPPVAFSAGVKLGLEAANVTSLPHQLLLGLSHVMHLVLQVCQGS